MKPIRYVVLFLFVTFCVSCIEAVDIEGQRLDKIVVNAMLSGADSVQYLTLSYNTALSVYTYDEVPQADVKLYCEGVYVGSYQRYAYGRWRLDYKPEENKEYRLTVEVEGYPQITAKTVVPDNNVGVFHHGIEFSKKPFCFSFNQQGFAHPYWLFLAMNDYRGSQTPNLEPVTGLIESVGTTHPFADRFNLSGVMMENGTTEEHIGYVRIDNQRVDPTFPFTVEGWLADHCVVFRNASEEYDRYMKTSIQKAILYNEEYDIARWFDESVIYSNIENGLGIFAGYNDSVCFIVYLGTE